MELLDVSVQHCICDVVALQESHQLANMHIEHTSHEENVHPVVHGMIRGQKRLRHQVVVHDTAGDMGPTQASLQLFELTVGHRCICESQPGNDSCNCVGRVQNEFPYIRDSVVLCKASGVARHDAPHLYKIEYVLTQ